MPFIARLYFKTAIVFLIIGISMGLQMSISGVHNVTGAHAHTNLLGWVTMALFGGYYALNPAKATTRLATLQYGVFTLGTALMVPSLYLMLSGYEALEPLVAVSSLIAFLGVILFAVVVYAKDVEVTAAATRPAV